MGRNAQNTLIILKNSWLTYVDFATVGKYEKIRLFGGGMRQIVAGWEKVGGVVAGANLLSSAWKEHA